MTLIDDPGDQVIFGSKSVFLTENSILAVLNNKTLAITGNVTLNGGAVGGGGGGSTVRTIVSYSGAAVTAILTDANGYVRFTGTNPVYTVPTNAAVAFPVGTQIDGIGTAGAMTIAASGGVTIVKARTLVTVGAGSGWTLIKVATDTWDLHGDFV